VAGCLILTRHLDSQKRKRKPVQIPTQEAKKLAIIASPFLQSMIKPKGKTPKPELEFKDEIETY
jgi:hypothetical protein